MLSTKQIKLLSYHIDSQVPRYGRMSSLVIQSERRISRGDSCNTSVFAMHNHLGTHIDCPRHFFESGKRISDFSINQFAFTRPYLFVCPKKKNQLIEKEDLQTLKLKRTDILLIKTGFGKHRSQGFYANDNPGISPESALHLRLKYPNLRAIGVDTISVSPYKNRQIGRETHRILLSGRKFSNPPLFIIEDMNLQVINRAPEWVLVVPIFIKGLDSSPCTIIAQARMQRKESK